MSRSQNLRHNVINQIIDDMARGHIPSPLPSQSALAEMYNISRTTVRHMLSHLGECGVLTQVGSHYVIVRKPNHDDGFSCTTASMAEQNRIFEQAFFTMINQRQLRAGESFSELQLARAAGVSPVVVREYLLKFERYNLIRNEKRGQWSMKQFDQAYAEQLFELREMLETHSLQHFLNLPDDDPRWLQAKRCWSATGYCVTASAVAFACFRSWTVNFMLYCFPQPIIYFLINHLRLFL